MYHNLSFFSLFFLRLFISSSPLLLDPAAVGFWDLASTCFALNAFDSFSKPGIKPSSESDSDCARLASDAADVADVVDAAAAAAAAIVPLGLEDDLAAGLACVNFFQYSVTSFSLTSILNVELIVFAMSSNDFLCSFS